MLILERSSQKAIQTQHSQVWKITIIEYSFYPLRVWLWWMMVSLLFHFGVFFTVCSDECFQCCGHSEGPSLKKSLYSCSCFHNRVCDYIHKHCTCRVQVPCPPETNRTFSAVIGQRYWHFFLQLISINVGRMLQKACVKNSSKLFVSSSNHHFRAKSLP